MKYIIIFLFITSFIVNAQVDTSVYYPMHIGDKWEYWSPSDGYYQVEIIGDTVMPNGKKYFVLTLYDRKYQRVEQNKLVMVYNDSYEDEYIRYDLSGKVGSIWYFFNSDIGFGIYDYGKDDNNLLLENLEWREYREAFIDTTQIPPDTLWNEGVDSYWPRITKGLGVTTYAAGREVLVGAVINGVGYGTLVGIRENNNSIVKDYQLFQNYPNPFNPTTKISYTLPFSSNVVLKIYDILGREIKTLLNKNQNPGKFSITWDGTDNNGEKVKSGIYLIKLYSGKYSSIIKTILLK